MAKSLKRTAQNLELYVYGSLGGKPSRPSRAPITTAFLERIEAETGLRTAQQVYKALTAVCRRYAKRNDAYAFPFFQGFWNTAQNKRSRQFSDQELRIFGTPRVSYMIKFILLTACRRTEASDWSGRKSLATLGCSPRHATKLAP